MQDKKVLIVDDSKTMVRIIENIVKQLGITDTSIAFNGKEALELMKLKKFDLVLSDVNMRSMNGFELVESIRQSGNKVGIFMITTEGGREEVIKALRLGANNYLVKPIDKDVLKDKITLFFKPATKG